MCLRAGSLAVVAHSAITPGCHRPGVPEVICLHGQGYLATTSRECGSQCLRGRSWLSRRCARLAEAKWPVEVPLTGSLTTPGISISWPTSFPFSDLLFHRRQFAPLPPLRFRDPLVRHVPM